MKPKGLKETTILMCIFNLAGYVFLNPRSPYLVIELSVGTMIVIFSFAVLWHYWHGKNWARVLVMITSMISILNLLGIKKHNMAEYTNCFGSGSWGLSAVVAKQSGSKNIFLPDIE